jgi:hypothetical protein
LRHNVIAGKGEAYKQLDCEVAERGAEVGAGRSSDERRNNRTRRSEGPVAGCATRPEGLRACCDAIHPSTTGGQVHAGTMSLGAFANVLALRNASARLPGGEPDEGELHVRFGEGLQETSRRKGFRACFLLHSFVAQLRMLMITFQLLRIRYLLVLLHFWMVVTVPIILEATDDRWGMFDEGVIDAIKVSRAAPESAASIARAAQHHRTAVVEQVVGQVNH